MTEELVVPATPLDPISKLMRLLEGWRDDEGKLHPGVIDRLETIEKREAERERARVEYEAQRRVILVAVGMALVGTLITQVTSWFNAHFK